ncbi:MAG: MerR family transcriptional regulator [Gammaproteobacteria bacterium]|nr:MerR family transcriptional regulator [Gammaproteobacteria bacterium]
MLDPGDNSDLPPIPSKRYFTIGEVSELCAVKPHVLRYWEQEFPQLKPIKRRGNRRYYQRHEVQLIRQIRSLLYVDGFTISGARNKLETDANGSPASSGGGYRKEIVVDLIRDLDDVVEILRD